MNDLNDFINIISFPFQFLLLMELLKISSGMPLTYLMAMTKSTWMQMEHTFCLSKMASLSKCLSMYLWV